MLIFIYTLLLSEEQNGKTWETSENKAISYIGIIL